VSAIERIREKIRNREYYLSSRAEEEMAEDAFERRDVENAILCVFVDKKMTRDARGTRYRIEGPAEDGRLMHMICRFRETGSLALITVYKLEQEQE
jgi:hypothetical protein